MEKYQDFKEFIKLLKEKKVEYLIVGGYAVTYHSRDKFTNDMDIWVNNTEDNSFKIFEVLKNFGFGNIDLKREDFLKDDLVLQLGVPPMRIDIMTGIDGLTFVTSFKSKKTGRFKGISRVNYISYSDLAKNKKIIGRPKDKFDLQWMKKYNNPKSRK